MVTLRRPLGQLLADLSELVISAVQRAISEHSYVLPIVIKQSLAELPRAVRRVQAHDPKTFEGLLDRDWEKRDKDALAFADLADRFAVALRRNKRLDVVAPWELAHIIAEQCPELHLARTLSDALEGMAFLARQVVNPDLSEPLEDETQEELSPSVWVRLSRATKVLMELLDKSGLVDSSSENKRLFNVLNRILGIIPEGLSKDTDHQLFALGHIQNNLDQIFLMDSSFATAKDMEIPAKSVGFMSDGDETVRIFADAITIMSNLVDDEERRLLLRKDAPEYSADKIIQRKHNLGDSEKILGGGVPKIELPEPPKNNEVWRKIVVLHNRIGYAINSYQSNWSDIIITRQIVDSAANLTALVQRMISYSNGPHQEVALTDVGLAALDFRQQKSFEHILTQTKLPLYTTSVERDPDLAGGMSISDALLKISMLTISSTNELLQPLVESGEAATAIPEDKANVRPRLSTAAKMPAILSSEQNNSSLVDRIISTSPVLATVVHNRLGVTNGPPEGQAERNDPDNLVLRLVSQRKLAGNLIRDLSTDNNLDRRIKVTVGDYAEALENNPPIWYMLDDAIFALKGWRRRCVDHTWPGSSEDFLDSLIARHFEMEPLLKLQIPLKVPPIIEIDEAKLTSENLWKAADALRDITDSASGALDEHAESLIDHGADELAGKDADLNIEASVNPGKRLAKIKSTIKAMVGFIGSALSNGSKLGSLITGWEKLWPHLEKALAILQHFF